MTQPGIYRWWLRLEEQKARPLLPGPFQESLGDQCMREWDHPSAAIVIQNRIIRAQAYKPAEQHVVVEFLHHQPLGADPVERLQQRGQQQLLGRLRPPLPEKMTPLHPVHFNHQGA